MARVRKEVNAQDGLVPAVANDSPSQHDGTIRVFNPGQSKVPQESVQGPAAASAQVIVTEPTSRCTVNGRPVKSMHLQVRDQPAFLVTDGMGTHEFSRVYYTSANLVGVPAVFKLGWAEDKLGPCKVLLADYETTKGLTLTLSMGLTHFIPGEHLVGNWEWLVPLTGTVMPI